MTDWKSKLAAYLHDPPSKCLEIPSHLERAHAASRQSGFVDSDVGKYDSSADHAAAAADRLPFPYGKIKCRFDGVNNTFRHPLSGDALPFHSAFKSLEQGHEAEGVVQPRLDDASLASMGPDEAARAKFFAHWRLWQKFAAEKDYRTAFLPADTRIPDHTIWCHMQVTSAFAGCIDATGKIRPAFLKFQLGPVQEFIAAARSIRDLWSGSYLLSWLMAAGLKALSAEVGPDAVIFPNLRGQPLFDLHWRKEIWGKVSINGQDRVWGSLGWSDSDLLVPNLPNVLLAIVPADRAASLGREVERAIRNEWRQIADAVWAACSDARLTRDEPSLKFEERRTRFFSQVDRFPSLSWQATPWPDSVDDALKHAQTFVADSPVAKAAELADRVRRMAEQEMSEPDRDRRFYRDDHCSKLNNIGLAWSVILARNGWELDAVRQVREFSAAAAGGWAVGTSLEKDSLTGREVAVAGGRHWSKRAEDAGKYWPALFKKDDWVSATTLIKRVWHRAYLGADPWNLQTGSDHFPMPNTRLIAAHEPLHDCDSDETAEDTPSSEKYLAVIAFDGDEIGKWMSGEKTPKFSSQLAHYGEGGEGAKTYFNDPRFKDFLESRRPLSPSYHLQFSEALGNFALSCARQVVEAFDGRLIYAGGDDVIALLPADAALECARLLRMAFRGDPELSDSLKPVASRFQQLRAARHAAGEKVGPTPYAQELAAQGTLFSGDAFGFISSSTNVDQQHRPIPFVVPGKGAEASVGVAIAHFKAPLQDVVRAAQAAEKRAKRNATRGGLGRGAVAVTLMKRSGEIIEWGAKWCDGLDLYRALAKALEDGQLSGKFPHRFAELLGAYLTETTTLGRTRPGKDAGAPPNLDEIIKAEFTHVLRRQRNPAAKSNVDQVVKHLSDSLDQYLNSLTTAGIIDPESRVRSLVGLCQTVAFAHRTAARDS